jgi:hypothetical protein
LVYSSVVGMSPLSLGIVFIKMSDGFGDGQQVFKPDQFRGDEKNGMSADILYLLSILTLLFSKLLST